MMFRWFLVIAALAAVVPANVVMATVSYRPAAPPQLQDGDNPYPHDSGARILQLVSPAVNVSIRKPKGWNSFRTEHGIILTEWDGLGDSADAVNAITIYLFLPALEFVQEFATPEDPDNNTAYTLLDHVRTLPDYVGDAAVSDPVAFEWDGYQAAYYLLASPDGTVTMLIAKEMANGSQILVCNITAPEYDADRLRHMLPGLLNSLTVDGVQLDSAVFESMPDPLEFPERPQVEPGGIDSQPAR